MLPLKDERGLPVICSRWKLVAISNCDDAQAPKRESLLTSDLLEPHNIILELLGSDHGDVVYDKVAHPPLQLTQVFKAS